MTKKRLGELLREEAQESPDPATEVIQEAAPDQLEAETALSETELPDETTTEPSSVEPAVTLRARRTGPTKAELETTVLELQEILQAAYGKENSLQQQIANLQSDLQEQKILVQNLQAALEQSHQIKAELEQAKKVILQLSAANSKTTREVNLPKKEVNTPKQEKKGTSSQKLGLKKLPYHSIQPDSPSGKTFEKNVGWFD